MTQAAMISPAKSLPDYVNMMSQGKTLVLIDGSNLYGSTKHLGFDVDFSALLSFFRENFNLIDAHFFATVDLDSEGKSKIIPFLDRLIYGGYQVTRKEVHRNNQNRLRESIDIEMAMTAMNATMDIPDMRNILIFSGNGDLESLIQSLRRRGKFVGVVSSAKTEPPLASQKVRKAANIFIEINDLMHDARAKKGMGINYGEAIGASFVPNEKFVTGT